MRVPIEEIFSYHVPASDQILQMQAIRELGKALALRIRDTPMLAEYRDDAIKMLHDVTMISNAGIILLPYEK